MGENEDKEVERRVDQQIIISKIENMEKKVDIISDGFEVFKKEWIAYQISCAKDNVVERIKHLEDRPQKSLEGWQIKLGIALTIVSIIVAGITIFAAVNVNKAYPKQDYIP